MNSHLLNYRFSPDQSDIQYSPPHSTSAEMCWWTCEQPGSAWLLQLPRAPQPTRLPCWGSSSHLPSSLLLTPPPPSVAWKEWEQSGRNSASDDGRRRRRGWKDCPPSTSRILPAPSNGWETESVEPARDCVGRSLLAGRACHGFWSTGTVGKARMALQHPAALSPCPVPSCCYFKWSLVSPPHLLLSPSSLFLMLVQQKNTEGNFFPKTYIFLIYPPGLIP